MKTKEELIATCQALRKNDPRQTKLNLAEYDALVDWKQEASKVAEALEDNTVVKDSTLSTDLCADSAWQMCHFLRSSPCLRNLAIFWERRRYGRCQQRERDPQDEYCL
jgi:hypothetical protein